MPSRSRDVLSGLSAGVPAELAERFEAWQRAPRPVSPAAAASVVLLRDGTAGLETYLLHRHTRMPFAPGMVVFPGGRVDPVDGTGADSFVACGVRETLEETGVRLAAPGLVPWAHWITPVFEPRRYDTWFFLARLPTGQHAADVSGETTRAEWRRPVDALADADAGRIGLMPPTRSILVELQRFEQSADALAAGQDREIGTVLPELVRRDQEWQFRYPGANPAADAPESGGTP